MRRIIVSLTTLLLVGICANAQDKEKPAPGLAPLADQAPNTWIKRSPLKGAPLSPMLGYEGSFGYDPKAKLVVRWAGHNQGGGGEQNAETWTYDPATAKWTLREPNTSPPGACCNAQNVFDIAGGRFLRFPAFSGSHGWHWFRENYLSNSSVWSYDVEKNRWRDMRPVPTPRPAPLRCASWDSDHQVVVIFGGEGGNDGTIVYDPYANEWTRMNPKKQPAGRSAGNMAYHKAMQKHILFGTQFSDDPHTWAYDLAKNEWTDLKPAAMPPTDKNDAVLAYDEHNKVIVASVRVFGQREGIDEWHYETWTYLHDENSWKKMNPNVEPPGGGQRRRIMAAIPDQNVILMENYVNPPQKVPGVEREQQIWTYRYAAANLKRKANPPSNVRVETTQKGAIIRWDTEPGAFASDVICFERRPDWPVSFNVPLSNQGVMIPSDLGNEFETRDLPRGKVHFYSVMVSMPKKGYSAESIKVRTQPRLVEDVIASVQTATKVSLTWPAAKEKDIVGYHVERAPVEVLSEDQIVRLRKDTLPLDPPSVGALKAIGKFEKLTKEPILETTFTDTAIDLRKAITVKDASYTHRFAMSQLNPDGTPYRYAVYAYRVRAVNKLGVESGAGPYALTIPSAPQFVFAKEDGLKCHLKWKKNPEQGLAGYRIYRMESPRINGPGQPVTRLTKDPVADNRYLDTNVNKDTRRYWIVGVDALGQEGYPSAPVWYERQFKKYYVPFTGEWHQ